MQLLRWKHNGFHYNICLDCGFESQRTFNRVFKDRYKITPREYRKGEDLLIKA